MLGFRNGFAGLIAGELIPLGARDVGGIIQSGGTFLGTARCPEFAEEAVQRQAIDVLNTNLIHALVVIGGNGSQRGSLRMSELGFPVVGIASTIDNDLSGSDVTIGTDTALNIALEAIDRLKVTASSHRRALLVEVMGRDCGYLALMAGITGGAEAIVIPEQEMDPETIALELRAAYERGKKHALVVVAEGAHNNAGKLVQHFRQSGNRHGFQFRTTILGHVQRGGTPTVFDRLLATRLGAASVEALENGRHGILIGLVNNQIRETPLQEVVSNRKVLDLSLLELARVLSE
jgi:6-phosphofructokinase 1